MGRNVLATTGRISPTRCPMMLGLGCAIVLAGCASETATSLAPAPATAAATAPIADNPPPPMAADTPPEPLPAPSPAQPSDPGADVLVGSMRESVGLVGMPAPGVVFRVSLDGVRNQSHATAAEFAGLCLRLADLLTRSGTAVKDGGGAIRFVLADDEPADYELQGSAYVVEGEDADLWELYLSLQPSGAGWTVWRAQGPVRMPRHPRPGEPQIVVR